MRTATTQTTLIGRMLSWPTPAARRQRIIVVIERYAPTTLRAAVSSLTWLFTDVVHGGLLPKSQSMHNGNHV
jgi:hypothetical protein